MKYFVASLIGAIIGYLTNWLAIKMLFRPYTEKRILGIKIPFTPGLIPKEKSRIASSVGDTIGEHLLSKDTIIESLCSREMNSKLRGWVKDKVNSLMDSTYTIEQEAKKIIGDKYDNFIEFIDEKVFNIIIQNINDEKVILSISREITNFMKKQLEKNPQIILDSDLFKEITKNFVSKGKNALKSDEFNSFMNNKVKEKIFKISDEECLLKDIFPKSFISTIQVCVYNNDEKICKIVKKLLNEEKTREKMIGFIKGMISSNVNPMIAMFLDPSTLTSKFINGVDKYLDVEANRKEIVIMINETIDRALENKVSQVMENFSEDMIGSNIESFVDLISEKVLDDRVIDSIYKIFEDKLRKNEKILDLIKVTNLEDRILEFTHKNIKQVINNKEVQHKIKSVINVSILALMNNKLCEIFQGKEEKIIGVSCDISEDIFNKFIENQASEVVETLNIPKIVENKINEFDVAFAEQIILQIASKELSAITWLGALLGGMMGVLSPLLSSIY